MERAELIERIEGEAFIDFATNQDGSVRDAAIRFVHFRGMEAILEGRPALDALVITPRVCGICGHSHLQAAVRMLESLYVNAGKKLLLSDKAQKIRRITLLCELIQNHIKWLYMIMSHESTKLLGNVPQTPLKALYITGRINQIAALFSGQWPHNSYALPGGVTCDPTHLELMQALRLHKEIGTFIYDELLGCEIARFESFRQASQLLSLEGELGRVLRNFEKLGLLEQGQSHNRFLVLADDTHASPIALSDRRRRSDPDQVSEDDSQTFEHGGNTYARKALYEGEFYETGPLARALGMERPLIKALSETTGNGALTRIAARVDESVRLFVELRTILETLDLSEASFIAPERIETISGSGIGIVEAPRGSLIHRATVENGKIVHYSIITPTQWNLGNGTSEHPGIAQKAMIGASSCAHATLLFRTFDVCSVCTTH
ncbi:MAG: nickel-dependent hydrogenase large subunit [Sulfuricurvum sp.]